MAEISDSLQLLFETKIEAEGDRYVVPVPEALVEGGNLSTAETYRVALLAADAADGADDEAAVRLTCGSDASDADPARGGRTQQPPVDEGDIRSVTIDTLGDKGDGIAKVERGFIVIVPGTEPGDQLNVQITDVKDTVAFAEPIEPDEG